MTTSTTQILFNSPALHSLKRDQLVKLCKIHSVKANGKNTELIARLKELTQCLPPEGLRTETEVDPAFGSTLQATLDANPLSPSMDEDDAMEGIPDIPVGFGDDMDAMDQDVELPMLSSHFTTRPSEQWEVVMEDIEEMDESRAGTMSSKGSLKAFSSGEFGTHSSKASVSSSIKALATSLGIKRVVSKASTSIHTQDSEAELKMTSFSPGKIFGSTKARDSLIANATPYHEIPPSDSLPETDQFKFSTPDASFLSMAEGDDTENSNDGPPPVRVLTNIASGTKGTIRLVSHPTKVQPRDNSLFMSPPRLPVVQTDFDLIAGTPGTVRTLNMWPASPHPTLQDPGERLYPKLPLDNDSDIPGGFGFSSTAAMTPAKTPARSSVYATSTTKTAATPVDEPDMFSPSKPTAMTSHAGATPGPSNGRTPLPRSTPFLFGSPLPRRETKSSTQPKEESLVDAAAGVSNAAFDGVAKSVLEEMHRRLAETNAARSEDAPMAPPQPFFNAVPTAAAPAVQMDRFAKAHDVVFDKMDSIATHYAARRPIKRKSDALGRGRPSAGQKRRSSAANARVISAGARKRMAVPGGFGGGDDEVESAEEAADEGERERADDEDAGDRRASKRVKITQGWDVHKGQRVSLAPPLPPDEEVKKAKEREAVKRELDAAKARRRSSRGRPSLVAPPPKAKSRFGFLSSAKSLVGKVWGIGGNSKPKAVPTASAPSNIPVPKPAPAPAPKASTVPASNTRKASGSQLHPSSLAVPSKLVKAKPSGSTADAKLTVDGTITSTKSSSSRSRSPIPPFTALTGTSKSSATSESLVGTARSRVSSSGSATGTASSRQTTRTSAVSSMGARTSLMSGNSAASSMGTRRSVASTNIPSSPVDSKEQPSLRKRTSSLLSPTASSLAKTAAPVKGRASGLPAVAEADPKPKLKRASATPSAGTVLKAAGSPMSPRPTRIFSQPLTNLGGSPASTTGARSLTAAATLLMADAADSPSKIPRPAVLPPKPKQLVARKPRISRGKVIAKLGAQRAAAAREGGLVSPGRADGSGARIRSSMGNQARRSLGAVKAGRTSAGADLRVAVKKRARQSEYVRRRSRAGGENHAVEV
ncbi:uncharacterized protein BXZ73DRAFT_103350 [Epithele typhae]|uniref:uncharacterized protein n=1 Tax=Epithele typhae TaxID=378194 RepID=UPI0020072535|nr:uncharacterized protein BXZ73DRAFT_103350 [Epithele typhae]KAH9924973.1 hypothetical protein BXZ73DRAFT_103350 [Epithele typhae]